MAAPAASTAPVGRPTGRDEITDAVLDAAERLFAAAGPNEVSLRAIAQEAGVTYGLVYRHFGTKDELLERLLARYADRWREHLGDDPDYEKALVDLMGPTFDTGPYLRLLTWSLLTGASDRGARATAATRRSTSCRRSPPATGRMPNGRPGLRTAGALGVRLRLALLQPVHPGGAAPRRRGSRRRCRRRSRRSCASSIR